MGTATIIIIVILVGAVLFAGYQYVKTKSNSNSCPVGYDPSTNCSTCAADHSGQDCPYLNCGHGSADTSITTGSGNCICDNGWKKDANGVCSQCLPNYTGSNCSICVTGHSGQGCPSLTCGRGTADVNKTTGSGSCICIAGWNKDANGVCSVCSPGYTGTNCDQCLPGRSGFGCPTLQCSTNSIPNTNDTTIGSCICSPGWTKDSTGNCSVCATGYTGTNCDQCLPGRSGLGCNALNCLHGTADTTITTGSGSCICEPNWAKDNNGICTICDALHSGPNCSYCSQGRSGQGCPLLLCTNTHSTADITKTTGTGSCVCESGWILDSNGNCANCATGYTGRNCDSCTSGRSGKNCLVINCNNGTANTNDITSQNGTCTCIGNFDPSANCSSCKAGYTGANCDQCAQGRSGEGCPIITCSVHSTANSSINTGIGSCTCDQGWKVDASGNCSSCASGYAGTNCERCSTGRSGSGCPLLTCSANSYADTSSTTGTGSCLCLPGWSKDSNGNCSICSTGYTGTNCERCSTGRSGVGCPLLTCSVNSYADTTNTTATGSCVCTTGWAKDSNGNCTVCSTGFTGPNCTQCSSGRSGAGCPILNCGNGVADTTVASGTGSCICNSGWTKDANGLCTVCDSTRSGTTCTNCAYGRSGLGCQELTCYNGTANTTDTTRYGSCICADAWAKDSNGLCTVCATGFTGTNCDQCTPGRTGTGCPLRNCGNGVADPTVSTGTGSCICSYGWAKDTNGNCTVCATDFTGAMCNQCSPGRSGLGCPVLNCQNGTPDTTITTGAGSCICNPNWSKDSNGICTVCDSSHSGSTCSYCSAGRSGQGCPLFSCSNVNSAVDTTKTTGTGQCSCLTGYDSSTNCTTCSVGRSGAGCPLLNCGGGTADMTVTTGTGSCICSAGWARDNNGLCTVCATGYTGTNCNQCLPGRTGVGCPVQTCNNHGTANTLQVTSSGSCICDTAWQNSDKGGFCNACKPGYAGPNCTSNFCGHGKTTVSSDPLSTTACVCDYGWVRASNGQCTQCATNFTGANCDHCVDGNSGLNCATRGLQCYSHGGTVNTYDITSPQGSCNCPPSRKDGPGVSCEYCTAGYEGPNCEGIGYCGRGQDTTQTNVAHPPRYCDCKTGWYSDGTTSQCLRCQQGYAGPDCLPDNLYCNNPALGSHGRAHSTQTDGPYADFSFATTTPCVCNNGWTNDASGLCTVCAPGYTGANCDHCLPGRSGLGCNPITCPNGLTIDLYDITSANGSCLCPAGSNLDPQSKCIQCLPGYSGAGCQKQPVCQNRGTVNVTDMTSANGSCNCVPYASGWQNGYDPYNACATCLPGYSGLGCAYNPPCENGSTADTSYLASVGKCTCTSNGFVSSPQEPYCSQCFQGYAGPNCLPDNLYCNNPVLGSHGNALTYPDSPGIKISPSTPCVCQKGWANNANGLCTVCATGYTGANCDQCKPGYSGLDCSLTTCQHGGTVNTADRTTVGGSCTCPTGYTGQFCQFCDSANGYGGPSCTTNYCGTKGTPSSDPNGLCTCVNSYDQATKCTTCLNKYDLSSDCKTCLNKYDLSSNCTSCLSGYNISGNCTTCLPNYNSSTNCSTCINKYDIANNCTTCLPNYNPATNCTTCVTGVIGATCNQCPAGKSGINCTSTPTCQHGGSINIYDTTTVGGSCTCPTGYAGQFCQLCAPGYAGPTCSSTYCVQSNWNPTTTTDPNHPVCNCWSYRSNPGFSADPTTGKCKCSSQYTCIVGPSPGYYYCESDSQAWIQGGCKDV